MRTLVLLIMCCLIFACNNSGGTKDKSILDTVPTNEEIPGVPPKKVTGSFAGEFPCSNCSGIEVLLKLTDTSFSELQNFKEAKDKAHSIAVESGRCIQDSGIIKLFGKKDTRETYRIINRDSIQLVPVEAGGKKMKKNYYLVRRGK